MKKSGVHTYAIIALSFILSAAVAIIISCGGSSTPSSNSTMGTVSTFLSDPPTQTCSQMYENVWVTITKVEANLNAGAGPNDSGWQPLVDLTNDPKQVDLLSLYPSAKNPDFCGTLYMLSKQQLPPGKYQQIRLILLANNASKGPSNDHCNGQGWNCVVPNGGSPVELTLPSEAQTGIKIPASQIDGGGLTVTAGQNTDLNIDINTCASIVRAGASGQYLLKPVLHAGEVSLNQDRINGKVIEAPGAPSPGSAVANAIVLLEQPVTDSNISKTVDRVVRAGVTGSDGTFSFCPMPASNNNYDIVVTGQTTQSSTTTTYNPTVLFNVPAGNDVGNIPIYAETAGTGTALDPATITGTIMTANSGPVAGTVQASALQSVMDGSNSVDVTIPVFTADSTPSGNVTPSQPPVYTTVTNTSSSTPPGCATSTADCVSYSIQVPASSPAIGTYSGSSNSFTAPDTTDQADYYVYALADGSPSLLTCSPTSMISSKVTVKAGDVAAPATGTGITVVEPSLALSFTGCQ